MRQSVKLLIGFLLVCLSFCAYAQGSHPKLPDDPVISKGTLPNGISYFLVANPSVKGVADIAILQKACQSEIEVPTRYLVKHGVGPGKQGYVRKFEGNIQYSFHDCPVAEGDVCLDTLLFMSVNIMGEAAASGEPAYGTTNQAIIVAGDIDRNTVQNKLKMMSMGIPLQVSEKPESKYEWHPGQRLEASVMEGSGPTAFLRYEYHLPAMPRENNGTAVTVMSYQLNRIFETILMTSVDRTIKHEGINCHDLSFNVLRSDAHEGDDTFYITLEVDDNDLTDAARIVPQIFNEIRHRGVSETEYEWAYNSVVSEDWIRAHQPVSNEEYVNRCVRSFLYNAGLATDMAKVGLYRKKAVADSVRVKNFNRYALGLITEGRTKVIVEDAPSDFTVQQLTELTADSGMRASLVKANYADTLSFPQPLKKKAKEPRMVADVMTGGNMWTYPNGISIIYKKMPTDGILYYSWVLRGGEEEAPKLIGGNVGHMLGEDFVTLLAANGITMDIQASSKDIQIAGTAEETSIQLLFKAFQFLFANRPELGSPAGGQLMMIGDRTDFSIQKSLQNLIMGFDVTGAPRQRRTVEKPWALDKSDHSVVYQALISGDELFSSDNVMVAGVAKKMLDEALVAALDGTGYYAEVEYGFVISPRDILNMRISVRKVDGMEQTEPVYKIRSLVRGAVSGLASKVCPANRVKAAKAIMAGELGKSQKTPQYWLEMARIRFSEAKDFVTKSTDKINKVTPDSVREKFKNLYSNGFFDYSIEN